MKRPSVLASVLVASTILAGTAYAADQSATAPQATQAAPQESAAQKTAEKDVAKLSADGAAAFRDMHLARVAIYDADPSTAKTLIGKAQSALGKAKADESVFTKAEADLKQSAAAKSAQSAPAHAKSGSGDGASASADPHKPVAWLPVDGQLTLGEDFTATPQKSAAVADANKSLATGDQKGAAEKLKLAGIDVDFTLAVLPLDTTTSDVDQAAKLLDQGKYYEANAILKQAEDGLRFDSVDAAAVPQKAGHAAGSAGTSKPAAH